MTRIKTYIFPLLVISSMLPLGILININKHEDTIFCCCVISQDILYCSLLKVGVQKLILFDTHIQHIINIHTHTNQYYCRIVESHNYSAKVFFTYPIPSYCRNCIIDKNAKIGKDVIITNKDVSFAIFLRNSCTFYSFPSIRNFRIHTRYSHSGSLLLNISSRDFLGC